jgi:integrase
MGRKRWAQVREQAHQRRTPQARFQSCKGPLEKGESQGEKPMKKNTGVQLRNGSYVAYLTGENGERIRRAIGRVSENAAILIRNKWALELKERTYIKRAPRKEIVTFAQIADKAVEYAKNYQRTWDADEGRAGVTTEWWGKLPVSEITTEMIDAKLLDCVKNGRWDAKRERFVHWTETTSNEYRTWLVSAFRLAKVEPNPAEGAVRYKLNNGRTRELSADEESRLRIAIRASAHRPKETEWELDLLLNTGERCSNLYGQSNKRRKPMDPLQWSDVDMDGTFTEGIPVINFPRSKGGAGYTMPLNAVALAALTELRKLSPDGTGAVIRKPSGIVLQSCRKWLANACAKANIVGVCPHVLRHTFGTRLRRNKVAFEDYEYLLGHNLKDMSLRYAHADLETMRDAVATLVPKPFLVEKTTTTASGTATKTATSAISDYRHAESA